MTQILTKETIIEANRKAYAEGRLLVQQYMKPDYKEEEYFYQSAKYPGVGCAIGVCLEDGLNETIDQNSTIQHHHLNYFKKLIPGNEDWKFAVDLQNAHDSWIYELKKGFHNGPNRKEYLYMIGLEA